MKPKLLINLPPGFFTNETLKPAFQKLENLAGEVRKTSHNTTEEIAEDVKWAEAIIMWAWPDLTDEILDEATNLKFIGHINGSRTMAEAELRHGIAVSEARHGWSPAVAEMALTLILTVLRKAGDHHAAMRCGDEKWVADFPNDIDPMERSLNKRRIGIVGFGKIGQRLVELLSPFQTKIQAYDPYLPQEIADKYGADLTELDELVPASEVIVLCAANTEEARHLITAEHIAAMRPGTLLVNVGRASLIDMEALTERLRQGDISAALDVFDKEPLEADSPLRTLPNAYLTPHRAGGIISSVEQILDMLTDDLERQIRGEKLSYQINEKNLHCLP